MSVGFIRPELGHLAVPIGEVAGYPGNARVGHRDRITASLTAHGQYKPLIVQASTGHVVVGNNTLAAMRDLGWSEVAVLRLEITDDRARELLLVDNRTSDDADYDPTALVDLLAGVVDWDATGWAPDDLDDLLAGLSDVDTTTLTDEVGDVDLLGDDPDPAPEQTDIPPEPPEVAQPPADIPPTIPTPLPLPEPTAAATPPPPVVTVLPPAVPIRRPPPEPTGPIQRPALTELCLHFPDADRAEALRLLAAGREWLGTDLTNGELVLRALRTLAAIGDSRHHPGTTLSIGTLLRASGYDLLEHL